MEHILLSSGQKSETVAHQTQRQFRQFSKMKGYRVDYEIFNGHCLEIHVNKAHTKPVRYSVDLEFLDPTPTRLRIVDWPLLGTAFSLLTAMVFVSRHLQSSAMTALQNPWFPAVILLSVGACIVGLIGLYRSSDKILFYSQHGRLPLVELLNKNPTRAQFHDFLHDLVGRIQEAKKRSCPSAHERLAAELREHRRLKDEAIIAADKYEAVKRRILSTHQQL